MIDSETQQNLKLDTVTAAMSRDAHAILHTFRKQRKDVSVLEFQQALLRVMGKSYTNLRKELVDNDSTNAVRSILELGSFSMAFAVSSCKHLPTEDLYNVFSHVTRELAEQRKQESHS